MDRRHDAGQRRSAGQPGGFQNVEPDVTDAGDVAFAGGARKRVENGNNSVPGYWPHDILLWA